MLCFARHYSKLVQVGCLEEYSFSCHVDVFNHFTPSPQNVHYYDCARVRMSASLFSVSDDCKSTATTPPPGPSIKLVAPKHQLANPEPLNSITWPHIDCQYIPWLGAMINIVHFRFQDLWVVEAIFYYSNEGDWQAHTRVLCLLFFLAEIKKIEIIRQWVQNKSQEI